MKDWTNMNRAHYGVEMPQLAIAIPGETDAAGTADLFGELADDDNPLF